MEDGVNIAGLRAFYHESRFARAFLDHAANRENKQSETTVERALTILNERGVEATRGDAVEMFKRFEDLGCGKSLWGRRGKPSRIAWSASIVSVGRAAVGEQQVVATIPETDENSDEAEEVLSHSYHLRPDYAVALELPTDLTNQEARRLAGYIRTLSME